MSELIQNWLNNEIELSQPITDFATDFQNGYLFGELLYKFNQQSNFKEFSKRETVNDKLDNFNKLETTLRNLKIKFDSRMVNDIIKGKRGIALQLLYQLKMALEKVYPPTDIAVLRKTGKMGDNQPALKIAASKEKYDTHAHIFFQQRLQVLNKPQKQLNIEKHLGKFEEEKVRQDGDAKQYKKELLEANDKVKQEIRKAQINKLQRNAGFMEEWLQKGVEDWKRNQTVKRDREKRELEFEYKQAEKYNSITMRKVDSASHEVNDGIAEFEKTLKSKGINPRVDKESAELAVTQSLQNSPVKGSMRPHKLSSSLVGKSSILMGGTQNMAMMTTKNGGMTLTSTGLKAKEKKTITEQTRRERERRRRKMIVDQSKTHTDMEQQLKESQIVERMKKQAKQEEELTYEQWRTNQCKNIIVENRKLREARYEKRRELDQQNANWREEEMLRQLEEQIDREMNVLQKRDDDVRIVHKQAKRYNRTIFADGLLDQIFEIANQAYIHQQLVDSEDIDSRNWHEWMQQFKEDLPITTKQESDIEDKEQFNAKLDELELVDYLKNKGQWPTTLITEYKVNVEGILTGKEELGSVGGAPPGKGAKQPVAKAQVEQIVLEEGDTEIPLSAPNNYALGDAVETIISINFEEKEELKKPIMPHYLNLKLCLIGYQFTGKKIQAQRIKDEYGLQLVKMEDLVQESIYYAEQQPNKADSIRYMQSQQQIDIKQFVDNQPMTDENEQEANQINAEEDFRQCGIKIQELLVEGKEISDEMYVQLFVAKLRMTFPYKTDNDVKQELVVKVQKERDLLKLLDEIQQEQSGVVLDSGKRKRSQAEIELEVEKIETELKKIRSLEKNGWILVDFPTSFAQSKLLETALSGYIPKAETDPVQREIEMKEASLIVCPTEKEQPPQELIKSGLDAVIVFDATKETCLRRAIGRRYDNLNEKMYHINNQPPLTTNAPLCERLTPMDEDFNSESTLVDRWVAYDSHKKSMEQWISQFGDAEIQRTILQRVDANANEEAVYLQVGDILTSIIEIKKGRENTVREDIMNQFNKEEEDERERVRMMKEEEEENKRREEEEIKMKEEEEKQAQLQREAEQAKLDMPKPELTKAEQAKADQQRNEQAKQELARAEAARIELARAEQQKIEQAKIDAIKVDKPEGGQEKIPVKPPSISNIDSDIKNTLFQEWSKTSSNFKEQMKKVFRQARNQREKVINSLSHTQNEFLHFLHRPDVKQEKLQNFIQEFNDFSDQYPDLREDDQTKDELHQRIDILSDELWEIIEERKEQDIEERKKIMDSGWIEYELGLMVSYAQQLMQSEVDRFKGSIQIMHDYFHLFEDKLIPETPPQITTELVMEGEELPPVEVLPDGQDQFTIENYLYPRLDKLFERALKSQVVPDVTIVQAVGQDKKAAPKGKDPKKPVEEEKVVEESVYVKEMKKAIKVEKQILRFRLLQIRNWSLKRLREMRQKSLKVYSKLDDWIHVATKTENEAVNEMCIVVKRAIEEEKKIQDELRIKFMDFCVDEKIMNFIIPPPDRLPAMEELRGNRFSIPQLKSLIAELQAIVLECGQRVNIPNKIIVDLFMRKLENAKSIGDESGFPKDWKSFEEYDFWTIVRNLDKYNQGCINWKVLASCICLLKSSIPNEKEIDQFQVQMTSICGKEGWINKEQFVQVNSWFELSESSQDRDYSIPFKRSVYIKELLFEINKQDKDGVEKLNVKKIVSLLRAKELTMFKKTIKEYNDILFAPVEK